MFVSQSRRWFSLWGVMSKYHGFFCDNQINQIGVKQFAYSYYDAPKQHGGCLVGMDSRVCMKEDVPDNWMHMTELISPIIIPDFIIKLLSLALDASQSIHQQSLCWSFSVNLVSNHIRIKQWEETRSDTQVILSHFHFLNFSDLFF